jgi:hypothetical protein
MAHSYSEAWRTPAFVFGADWVRLERANFINEIHLRGYVKKLADYVNFRH